MTMPNVFAEGEGWTLYRGDAIAVLPTLGGINGVITDPPYSSGGAMRGDRTASPNAKYLRGDSKQADYIPTFAGDNRDQRSYLAWSALWLGMCLDLAQPGAVLCCFTDWRQLPVTTDAVQGVVLDPFAGSGTTGVAALLSGRRFVGVERCLEHCEVAARRLSEASGNYRPSTTPQLGLLGGA